MRSVPIRVRVVNDALQRISLVDISSTKVRKKSCRPPSASGENLSERGAGGEHVLCPTAPKGVPADPSEAEGLAPPNEVGRSPGEGLPPKDRGAQWPIRPGGFPYDCPQGADATRRIFRNPTRTTPDDLLAVWRVLPRAKRYMRFAVPKGYVRVLPRSPEGQDLVTNTSEEDVGNDVKASILEVAFTSGHLDEVHEAVRADGRPLGWGRNLANSTDESSGDFPCRRACRRSSIHPARTRRTP